MRGKIGFEAKRYFNNHTGLGNYARWLVNNLVPHWTEPIFLYNPQELELNTPGLQLRHSGSTNRLKQMYWRSRGMVKDIEDQGLRVFHGLSQELPFGIHKAGVRSVVTIHDLIQVRYPENYSRIDRKIYNRKVRYAQEHADVIITPSSQTKKDLIRYFDTDESKIKVIPIGSDVIKRKLGNRNELEGPYVLCISSFTERKNLVRLYKAFQGSKLAQETKLVIAGRSGPVISRLKRIAVNDPALILVENPSDSQIAALLEHCAFTIYPSMFEGFGIPVLESFIYGKTACLSERSSIPEVGGEAATYFNPKDVVDIRASIENMWFSTNQRDYLESMVPLQLAKFETKPLIKSYLNIYSELL